MKQLLQDLKDGHTLLAEVPCPAPAPHHVLIESRCSLISPGTERMLLEFGKAGWIEKARSQPEKVRQVLQKVKTDGLLATWEAVESKLSQPLPLGYCNVGVVVETEVPGFAKGMRVVSNGPHAEVVRVPANLCAAVPEAVSDEQASFTVLGAIALQGIRLLRPELGETFVVIGLGIIGLLGVQLLRAHGCRVLGMDLNPQRLALAREFGAETADLAPEQDPAMWAMQCTQGVGADGVLIAAAAKGDSILNQAAGMCRKRGRIVLTGVVDMKLARDAFYKKELSFQVSCSYGPGRYDPVYETQGMDYPLPYVRWTARRNFEAVLAMMADGKLNVAPLIEERVPIEDAAGRYEELLAGSRMATILTYPATEETRKRQPTLQLPIAEAKKVDAPRIGVLGAGNYASRVLIPAFRAGGAVMQTLVSSGGLAAAHHGTKFGFARASTDEADALQAEDVDAVVIATRHNQHGRQVLAALEAGKHVFVEKPLALVQAEVDAIEEALTRHPGQILMVGFNRRFAPLMQRMASLLAARREPKAMILTMNAGKVPAEHWTQDRDVGGGRIIGEACHFIDLARFLAGSPIEEVQVVGMEGAGAHPTDTAMIQMRFANGSIASVHYLANGGKDFPKERIEVFCGGAVLQLDNFRKLNGYGWPGFRSMRVGKQDKGQKNCARAFLDAIRSGGKPPIPAQEILEVARVTLQVGEHLQGI